MSEHQFKGIYNLGYGDAVYENHKNKKGEWLITIAFGLVAVVVTFWAGRASMYSKVTEAYNDGFEAGVREGTTQWGEWK